MISLSAPSQDSTLRGDRLLSIERGQGQADEVRLPHLDALRRLLYVHSSKLADARLQELPPQPKLCSTEDARQSRRETMIIY